MPGSQCSPLSPSPQLLGAETERYAELLEATRTEGERALIDGTATLQGQV